MRKIDHVILKWAKLIICSGIFFTYAETKSIYVVGLESSGTRALTKLIASMVSPATTSITWDGANPPCYNNVHHVSLPYNDFCTDAIPIIKDTFAPCGTRLPPHPRFILNISHILQTNINAVAVIVTRSLQSVWTSTKRKANGVHCDSFTNFSNESRLALTIMKDALESYPAKTIVVSYHSLAYFKKRIIYDLAKFFKKHNWNTHEEGSFQWHDRDFII